MKNHNAYPSKYKTENDDHRDIKWVTTPDGEIDWAKNPIRSLEGVALDSLDAVGEYYRKKAKQTGGTQEGTLEN